MAYDFKPFELELHVMTWNRRKDLEGGKELGVWLERNDDGDVVRELYVESHEYRGGDFDVYTATPSGDWNHIGEFEDVNDAFDEAEDLLNQE